MMMCKKRDKKMTKPTAKQVANAIIDFCNKHGDFISNLKLQKLIYYAQAWYLALYNKPLFDEPLEAWVHGPVQPAVYRRFKSCGYHPIGLPKPAVTLSVKVVKHIEEIMKVYGGLSAFVLERHVHSEKPWRIARGDLPPDKPSHSVISTDEMRKFYRAKLK